jgi:hypothetical protein
MNNFILLKAEKRTKLALVESKCKNISESEIANKSWNIYLSSDDSIIVDLFQVYQIIYN